VYGAEADVLLTPRPELSDNAVDRALLTQTLVVVSPSVLQPVASRTGIPLDRLQRDVSAGMVNRSNILRITVADRERDRAVTVAQLVVVEYVRVAAGFGNADTAPLRLTVLTPARQQDHLVQPQPWRALAGGTLVGLLVAALVVFLLRRPGRVP
jgi:capsular polysaccharide biosynthesis protein